MRCLDGPVAPEDPALSSKAWLLALVLRLPNAFDGGCLAYDVPVSRCVAPQYLFPALPRRLFHRHEARTGLATAYQF
jgi:hypothetical protein